MLRLPFLGFSLAAMWAAPALAQAPAPEARLGSRIPFEEESAGQRETERVLHQFARCVVNLDRELIASLMDPPYAEPFDLRTIGLDRVQRQMSYCLGAVGWSRLRGNRMALQGAFAEQLYRGRFDRLPALGATSLPQGAEPSHVPTLVTLRFAGCLIERNAGAVDSLIRTRVGSPEAAAAYNALSPAYSACLDAGSTLRMNRLMLRTSLADQLYRRALAGAGVARPGGGA